MAGEFTTMYTIGCSADADTNGSMVADFSNGLLGVGDQVQEDLGELAGVAEDEGEIGRSRKINGYAI